MGWSVQLDPTSETWHISTQMYLAIEPLLRDYDMRYCYIQPSQQALGTFRALAHNAPRLLAPASAADFEESRVIGHILYALERKKRVELLFGH